MVYRLNDCRIGRAWVAIREDEVAAAAMGINTTILKLLAFAIGAFFAGRPGRSTPTCPPRCRPTPTPSRVSVLLVAMVVLGGMGNAPGALLGAVVLTFLPEKLRAFSGQAASWSSASP